MHRYSSPLARIILCASRWTWRILSSTSASRATTNGGEQCIKWIMDREGEHFASTASCWTTTTISACVACWEGGGGRNAAIGRRQGSERARNEEAGTHRSRFLLWSGGHCGANAIVVCGLVERIWREELRSEKTMQQAVFALKKKIAFWRGMFAKSCF
jgi:hypothetical protein